jgi:RNA binding exosome subunit
MPSLVEHFDVLVKLFGIAGVALFGLLGLQYRQLIGKVDRIEARMERHMTEEESKVWGGIRDLGDKLTEIQVENVKAHAQIVTEYGQRLAKIEAKMPNGEISEMLGILRKLSR